jgi:lysophospholipase L1-like esterase
LKYQQKKRNEFLFLCFFLVFYACGGDSGSGDPVTPENKSPVADAGSDQYVSIDGSNTVTVTLVGSSNDIDGRIVSHQWDQTGGPAVTLGDTSKQSTSVTIPASTEAYTFSYTVTDDGGAKASDEVLITATRILFSDSFSDGSGWSYRWTDVTTGDPADWGAINGGLLQYNNVSGLQQSYRTGTYAVLTAVNVPSDYRFSVDITPLPNYNAGEDEGNDVGIMFRYSDANNYYRVSMNANSGFTRFEKREYGSFETLAVNAIGYVENQPMTMTADVNGGTIIVWIDGDPVFATEDSAISSGSVALYCQDKAQFDNVRITEAPLQPMVAISSPVAYSVIPGDGGHLSAEALVLNKPVGAKVFFSMDNENPIEAVEANGLFSAEFKNVSNGNHEIVAILENSNGNEIDLDINSTIGVGGDYYVSIGDSITNGEGDHYPGNNESADGRIIGIQGYQATLADLLTENNRPQIVFNEGIGGDTANDLKSRIRSILDRHPQANKVLMMIGTNDSYSVDADSYDSSVRETVRLVNDVYGKQLWIAKPPPTYIEGTWTLDTNRNNIIAEYNQKIMGIVDADPYDNTYLGPNFYQTLTNTYDFDDYLHPNDAGYQFMADEWNKKLP